MLILMESAGDSTHPWPIYYYPGNQRYTSQTGGFGTGVTGGRHGNSLRPNAPSFDNSSLTRTFSGEYAGAAHAKWIWGGAFGGWGSNTTQGELTIVQFRSGATEKFTLTHENSNTNGMVYRLRRGGASGTVIGTAVISPTPILNSFRWEFIELKVDTGGNAVLRRNGAQLFSVASGSSGTFDTLQEFLWGFSQSPALLDDMYLCNGAGTVNNDFLGDVTEIPLKPTGNGTTSNGVGSDGNSVDNYALVDDGPTSVDLADYVSFTNTGDKDTYTFEDLGAAYDTPNIIRGVQVSAMAQKADTGVRSLTFVCRLAGVESERTGFVINDPTVSTEIQWLSHHAIFETDPSGNPWTRANLNAAEFGVKAGA